MFPVTEHSSALKNFTVLDRLGSGGAGQVYLARSKGGRLVAIKILSDAKERDPAFSRALAHEASLCVRLVHPAIVQVRAFLEDEGFAALVFDYIEGLALSKLMKFCAAQGVRLPDRATWHVVERVLSALAFAHAQTDEAHEPAPIVHRDVSPSNVLLGWSGDVKLTDFGIAKMLGVSPATQFGLVKGTLGCMAPEQARGEPVDERADVYAAGLLGWRLSTGRNPFAQYENEEMELLRAMRNPRIKPLSALRPKLPEPLLDAVGTALAVDPQNRTISAEHFAEVVRGTMDVDAGRGELEELLRRWRSVLDRTRLRADGTRASTISSDHGNDTMRYQDVGGGEEEPPADGVTLQVQALPGDEQLWAALAREGLNLPRVSISDSEHARASQTALEIARDRALAAVAVAEPPVSEPLSSHKMRAAMAIALPTEPMVPVQPMPPPRAAPTFPPPISQPPPAARTIPPEAFLSDEIDAEELMLRARRRSRTRTIVVLFGILVLGLALMYAIAGRT